MIIRTILSLILLTMITCLVMAMDINNGNKRPLNVHEIINGDPKVDIITAINGTLIDEKNDLAHLISAYPVGTDILIDFERNGGKFSVTVKLGKQ